MPEQKKVKYYVRVCLADADSCDECKKHDGDMWRTLKEMLADWPFIGSDCRQGKRCRCDAVAVYQDEGTVTSNVPEKRR